MGKIFAISLEQNSVKSISGSGEGEDIVSKKLFRSGGGAGRVLRKRNRE
jgi:hypothetical protein